MCVQGFVLSFISTEKWSAEVIFNTTGVLGSLIPILIFTPNIKPKCKQCVYSSLRRDVSFWHGKGLPSRATQSSHTYIN